MGNTQAVMAAIGVNSEAMHFIRTVANRFEKLNNMPVRVIEDHDV